MIVRKAFKYHLYPTPHQAERLAWVLRRCQELYNAALYQRREAYRVCGASVCYYAQKRDLSGIKQERHEYREIGSQVLQDRPDWLVLGSDPQLDHLQSGMGSVKEAR